MKYQLTILTLLIICFSCTDDKCYTTTDNELKLDILPIETNRTDFDLPDTASTLNTYLYIGKVKTGIKATVKDEFGYFLQLNDVVRNTDDLKEWLTCYDCDESKFNIIIIADKDVPEQLLTKVEYIIRSAGNYFPRNIYYYEKNTQTGYAGYNHQESRIVRTKTATFNKDKYVEFIKHFMQDSIKVNWVYKKPVRITNTIPYEYLFDSSSIPLMPPPPPSIFMYRFDSLSFNDNMFESVKVVQTPLFEHKIKRSSDSLSDYYGRIITFSLPYKSYIDNYTYIDYEVIDWGWCGTDKYQTLHYTE